MFKVLEKPDGSTVIVCPRTNRPLFVLKPQSGRKETKPVPIAIGRPIPQALPHNGLSSPSSSSAGIKKPSACVLPLPRVVQPPPEPVVKVVKQDQVLPPPCPEVPDVDYSDDCITCDQFMQTLNLIPSKDLASSGPSVTQQHQFPLRNISKRDTAPQFIAPTYAKVYEEMDIFSPLGKKWMNEGPMKSRYIISDSAAEESNHKHAFYCRVSLLKPGSKDYDVPKLRCREMKPYPETYKPQKNSNGGCHMYSFTKRERLERLEIIRTGLNERSRRLKRLCKPVKVHIKRLDEKLIKELTRKKPRVATASEKQIKSSSLGKASSSSAIPVIVLEDSDDCSEEELSALPKPPVQNMTVKNAKKSSQITTKLNKDELLVGKNVKAPRCSVVLNDIKNRIVCVSGVYYVRNSSVRVLQYLESQKKLVNHVQAVCNEVERSPTPKMVIQFPSHDHPYHRVKPPTESVKIVSGGNSVLTVSKNPLQQKISLGPSVSRQTVTVVVPKFIPVPVVNLANSSGSSAVQVAASRMAPQSSNQPTFIFQCFGCRFQKTYTNKALANKDIHGHMTGYHSVLKPEMFIQCYPDTSKNVFWIEAFPGYKSSGMRNALT